MINGETETKEATVSTTAKPQKQLKTRTNKGMNLKKHTPPKRSTKPQKNSRPPKRRRKTTLPTTVMQWTTEETTLNPEGDTTTEEVYHMTTMPSEDSSHMNDHFPTEETTTVQRKISDSFTKTVKTVEQPSMVSWFPKGFKCQFEF